MHEIALKMKIVDINEAKSNLSRLIDEAANGKPFVIAKLGKPLVKVAVLDPPPCQQNKSRLGFMSGHIAVPDDFDSLNQSEIRQLFGER